MNDHVAAPAPDPNVQPCLDSYNEEEWCALMALQWSYQQGHDLLSARELARLRFLRWLVDTGRITP